MVQVLTGREPGRAANALTVDVEDYFHVSAFAKHIAVEDWSGFEPRVRRNTLKLLEMFAEEGVKATFFALGWVAENDGALIEEIAAAGHEVACHGFSHQLVYDQTPEQFSAETKRSKDCLEQLVQRPVLGYRAASYSIVERSKWALDVLAELGFRYDSSIFPVHHDRYGIPGAPRRPHVMRTPGGAELVEFPLSTLQTPVARIPVSGGGYFRLLPYSFTRWALRRLNRTEELPFIFYLHPWEIDPEQPRVDADWIGRFRHYQGLAACEGRLRRLLRDFEFDTAARVLGDLGLLEAQPERADQRRRSGSG
jgi:polysaccharide deacetylase family protein (PEP-CTERM system associated)